MGDKPTEEVKPAGGGSEASTEEKTPEEVTSPEVKVETPAKPAEVKVVDTAKMQEQIDNLNTALKQERDKPRVDPAKVTELETQLKESQTINEKLKKVFVHEETPAEETSNYKLSQ